MATANRDDLNPFRAPKASIAAPTLAGMSSDAELIRRTFIKHEASVKSIGVLFYLGAFGSIFGAIALGYAAFNAPATQGDAETVAATRLAFGGMAALLFVLIFIYGALGYGLRRLQPWARWTTLVLTTLLLLWNFGNVAVTTVGNPAIGGIMFGGVLFSSIIPIYILYLVASAKGRMVFSGEYREVIRQTPHVKYKTSIVLKIFLALLVGVLLLAIIGGIIGGMK